MYQVVKHSNLLEVTGSAESPAIICHVVNDQGVMGAGIAKHIRAKWPNVYSHYRRLFEIDLPGPLLGTAQGVYVDGNLYVANLFAQTGLRSATNPRPFNLRAFQRCLMQVGQFAQSRSATVHVPYGMGAGLAGGNWNEIEQALRAMSIRWHLDVLVHQWP